MMIKRQVWIHTQRTFTKKGKKNLVIEGMHKKGTIDWGSSNSLLQASIAGWKLKGEKTWETIQEYGVPNLTGITI